MGSYILGPYFFDENVNGEEYLRYLQTDFQNFLKAYFISMLTNSVKNEILQLDIAGIKKMKCDALHSIKLFLLG